MPFVGNDSTETFGPYLITLKFTQSSSVNRKESVRKISLCSFYYHFDQSALFETLSK